MRKPTFLAAQILSITFSTASVTVLSGTSDIKDTHSSIQITLTGQKDSAIRLEARQAPLGQILKRVAVKTGAIIHYSVLPEAPVTATCVGANVGQIMDCLVAKQVGLVAHSSQKDKPAEFWLLGSSVGSCQAVTIHNEQPGLHQANNQQVNTTAIPGPTPEELEQIQIMLKQAKSKDPAQRAEALSNLGLVGQKEDANIRKTLEEAMVDKDANVRTQAITSLMQREGDDAAIEVQQALKDKDVNVRIAVIGNVLNDTSLLQQALNDGDKTVRELAASRLNDLSYRQNR